MSESIFNKKMNEIFYSSFIKKSLNENKLTKELVTTFTNKIEKVVYYCDESAKNLLIVGKVQSGKTNFFLGLISKLLDQGTNIVVVFAGVDKEIYKQNLTRIENVFSNNMTNKKVVVLSDKNKDFNFEQALKDGKKIIICSLKNSTNINKWNSIIKKISYLTHNSIIIDDEGDQFSFDNIKKEDKTPTNKSINELFKSLNTKYTFITVTATPYAHILVDGKDSIKPDYAFVMNINKEYIGLNFFNESICDNRDDITNPIPENEILQFYKNNTLEDTFNEALITFLFNGTIFYYLFDEGADMLINPDTSTDKHKIIYEILKLRLEQFKELLKNEDSKINKILERKYQIFIKSDFYDEKFKQNHNEFSFKDIKDSIIKLLEDESKISYFVINGKKIEEYDNLNRKIDNDKKSYLNFYIGSNKLSRGITIKNLITSFIFRGSKSNKANLDTNYQMARWLGYRNEYKYLLTLYLSENLINNFKINEEIDENAIEHILRRAEDNGLSIKEIKPQIDFVTSNYKTQKLNATRDTVAKQSMISNHNQFKNTFFKNKWKEYGFEKEDKINKELFYKIEKRIKQEEKIVTLKNLINSSQINNYPSTIFNNFEELENYLGHNNLKEMFSYINFEQKYIDKLTNEYKDKKIICSIMTKNNNDTINNYQPRLKKYYTNKQEINILFNGATDNYIGDRYWQVEANNKYIFIQFYIINFKKNITKDDLTTIYKSAILLPISNNKNKENNFSIISVK